MTADAKTEELVFDTRGTGVCCTRIRVVLDGDTVRSVKFANGCVGNHRGIEALVRGRPAREVASLLQGIKCQNGTSCPDQLAKALLQALADAERRAPRSAATR